jgi:hypothetical protein
MGKNGKRLGFLPGWRKGTYIVLAFNLLMLVWIIAGAAGASGDATDCGSLSQDACNAAADVGTGIGVALLVVLWVFGDIILGVLWLVTNRKKGRDCPVCGHEVKKGVLVCSACGHDFRAAAAAPTAPPSTA